METIPIEYLIFIYGIMTVPFILVVLCVITLIAVTILYFTNRSKAALKLLKVLGIVIVVLAAFIWLTKSSLGI